MSLKIRLARAGSKKRPFYHIVIADARAPRDGRFVEKIGTYNPMLPKEGGERIQLDTDRAKHWLDVGAQATDRVARFLDDAGLLKREARSNPKKALPGQKATDRAEEKAKKQADAKAAAEMPAEEPAAEAPAEESAPEAPAEEAAAEEAKAE